MLALDRRRERKLGEKEKWLQAIQGTRGECSSLEGSDWCPTPV